VSETRLELRLRPPSPQAAGGRLVNEVGYLLDTNVVSALRRPDKEPLVAAWAATIPLVRLYLAAPVVAEIGLGVAAKERQDPAAGAILRAWFEGKVLPAFGDRILPFDTKAALILTAYRVPTDAPYDDALIAAVAEANGLTVATRNVSHFASFGVPLVNPWDHSG